MKFYFLNRLTCTVFGIVVCVCAPINSHGMSLPAAEQPESRVQEVAVPQNNRGQLSRLLQKSRNILNSLSAPPENSNQSAVPALDGSVPEGIPPEEVEAYRQKLQEWMSEDSSNADPYDVILSVKRKGRTISRSVIGIQKGIQTYIPMQDLANALRFKINMDLATQTVGGFWNSEDNTYGLDILNNSYSVKGESFTLPADTVIVQDFGEGLGDIYITSELLNELWGLNLRFDQAQMALLVQTPQLLPVEREKLRNARQEKFLERNANAADQYEALDYRYVPNDYKIIGKPAVNSSSQIRWDDKNQELSQTSNLRGVNDLLFTSADYNIQTAYSDEEGYDVTSARLRLERRADIGHELPLGLKLFEAGDISVQPPSLIDRNQTGTGISVSNKPFKRAQSFDIITVEGTGQPGWDVEVYNENRLQNFGVIDANGEYSFEGIELDYGKNEIRTILYGPQGQVEERIEDYNIDNTLLAQGDVRVEATLMDANRNLIEVDDVSDRITDGYFHTASVATGLNERFTPFVTSTRANTEAGTKNYVSVGTNFTAGGGIGVVEGYKDLSGGTALDARYARNFAGLKLNARTAFFNDFESEEANFGSAAKDFDSELRVATSVPTDYGSLRLGTNVGYTGFADGSDRTTFVTSQSLGQAGLRLSNRTTSRLNDGEHQQSNGRLSADYRISDLWNFRSSANYDISPETDFNSALAELRYNDRDRFNASADVRHDLENNNTSLGVDASYDFRRFLGGIGLNWDVGDGFDAILRTSMSLGPFGNDNSYIMTSDSLTGKTALKSRIYRDKNEDGVFSEGDEPIENARLRVNGVRTEKTNEDGIIDVVHPTGQGIATVVIDDRSWEDELLVSKDDGYYTALRPVTKPYIDIPVVVSGSLDGNVYFADGKPSPTLRVQLINADGQMVEETTTDFNGYYSFEYIRPGNYVVRADPTHNLVASSEPAVVTQDDPFVFGIDLKVAGLNPDAKNEGPIKTRLNKLIQMFEKRKATL